ncbi:hypothetical protein KAT08_01375 [Candidatus Babeliales bacterium]|nr:hypothetical protein [Candidatus Babeliales bacterium]
MKQIKIISKIRKSIRIKENIRIPLSVPVRVKEDYIQNYLQATSNSGRLFLFAGDQKIEHLNKDFYGKGISKEDENPEHLFKIASCARIGAFATQLGLISKYADDYRNVNYIVKLNSKTDLLSKKNIDPISLSLNSVEDVVKFQRHSGLSIVGVGYTIYLGSQYEAEMLSQAAQIVFNAHQYGLITVLWMYPRGKEIKDEKSFDLIAGAAGVGVCLGTDFVKINPPNSKTSIEGAKKLKHVTMAAGRTKVICSGGKLKDENKFLMELSDQINIGGAAGCAVGRNVHQKDLDSAIKFCNNIAAIVIDGLKFKEINKI